MLSTHAYTSTERSCGLQTDVCAPDNVVSIGPSVKNKNQNKPAVDGQRDLVISISMAIELWAVAPYHPCVSFTSSSYPVNTMKSFTGRRRPFTTPVGLASDEHTHGTHTAPRIGFGLFEYASVNINT